jgi:hypothetical protein
VKYPTGFIREFQIKNGDRHNPVYLIEGVVESKKSNLDVIHLLKSRKYNNQYYSKVKPLNLQGTAAISSKFDFVKNQLGPLNKKNYNSKFNFYSLDTLNSVQGRLFKIGFKEKRKRGADGYLIINSENLSVLEFSLKIQKEKPSSLSIREYKKSAISILCNYEPQDSLYYLSKVRLEQDYFPIETDTFQVVGYYQSLKRNFFDTVYIGDKTFSQRDILYNIIENEGNNCDTLDNSESKKFDYLFLKGNKSAHSDGVQRMKRPIKSRFRISYVIPFWISQNKLLALNFNHPEINIQDTIYEEKNSIIALSVPLTFELSENFLIELAITESFNKKYLGFYFGIYYEQRLSKKNNVKPYFLLVGVRNSLLKHKKLLGTYDFKNDFSVKRKNFNSNKLDAYFEQRLWQINPTLILSYQVSPSLRWQMGASYLINLNIQNGILLKEDDSFFKKKKAFVTDGVSLSTQPSAFPKNNLMLFIGFELHLN